MFSKFSNYLLVYPRTQKITKNNTKFHASVIEGESIRFFVPFTELESYKFNITMNVNKEIKDLINKTDEKGTSKELKIYLKNPTNRGIVKLIIDNESKIKWNKIVEKEKKEKKGYYRIDLEKHENMKNDENEIFDDKIPIPLEVGDNFYRLQAEYQIDRDLVNIVKKCEKIDMKKDECIKKEKMKKKQEVESQIKIQDKLSLIKILDFANEPDTVIVRGNWIFLSYLDQQKMMWVYNFTGISYKIISDTNPIFFNAAIHTFKEDTKPLKPKKDKDEDQGKIIGKDGTGLIIYITAESNENTKNNDFICTRVLKNITNEFPDPKSAIIKNEIVKKFIGEKKCQSFVKKRIPNKISLRDGRNSTGTLAKYYLIVNTPIYNEIVIVQGRFSMNKKKNRDTFNKTLNMDDYNYDLNIDQSILRFDYPVSDYSGGEVYDNIFVGVVVSKGRRNFGVFRVDNITINPVIEQEKELFPLAKEIWPKKIGCVAKSGKNNIGKLFCFLQSYGINNYMIIIHINEKGKEIINKVEIASVIPKLRNMKIHFISPSGNWFRLVTSNILEPIFNRSFFMLLYKFEKPHLSAVIRLGKGFDGMADTFKRDSDANDLGYAVSTRRDSAIYDNQEEDKKLERCRKGNARTSFNGDRTKGSFEMKELPKENRYISSYSENYKKVHSLNIYKLGTLKFIVCNESVSHEFDKVELVNKNFNQTVEQRISLYNIIDSQSIPGNEIKVHWLTYFIIYSTIISCIIILISTCVIIQLTIGNENIIKELENEYGDTDLLEKESRSTTMQLSKIIEMQNNGESFN